MTGDRGTGYTHLVIGDCPHCGITIRRSIIPPPERCAVCGTPYDPCVIGAVDTWGELLNKFSAPFPEDEVEVRRGDCMSCTEHRLVHRVRFGYRADVSAYYLCGECINTLIHAIGSGILASGLEGDTDE